jgi:lipopolysaccharide export system permease protein
VKRIDKLVITGFIGPYLMSFFVAEFVLLMQFLWKNIDDILGKGFGLFNILELIFYFGVTIIHLSVPVTILISSVMVFGNLSERYELSSLKSAGIPLTRTMRSAIILAVGTGLFSLLANNYLKPRANFKFQQRFKAIQKSKSSLILEEGVFDSDFTGYVIRVGKKDKNGRDIEDVLMYDQENNSNNYLTDVTKARTGEMYTKEDGRLFVMNLKDGEQIRELRETAGKDGKKYPLMRTYFKTYKKMFDMSNFQVEEDNVNINRNKKDMLNTFQLLNAVDSLKVKRDDVLVRVAEQFRTILPIPDSSATGTSDNERRDKLQMEEVMKKFKSSSPTNQASVQASVAKKRPSRKIQIDDYDLDTINYLIETVVPSQAKTMYNRMHNSASNQRDVLRSRLSTYRGLDRTKSRYLYTLHQQYAWALSCIVFLFIGAPLGSIIRKGGYGYPLLFAIVFYILLFISTIMGNKLNRNGTLHYLTAAYLPILILLPFAMVITYKALTDSKFSFTITPPQWLSKLLGRVTDNGTI